MALEPKNAIGIFPDLQQIELEHSMELYLAAYLVGGTDNHITTDQTKHYSDFLKQGHYLVSIDGTQEQISQAESVLKNANIQDWLIFTEM